ncbi:MAG: ATP-binding protein, partial [Fulvivirga sp.]|nr:ATP-binding protein [Fulvivirga sp.]
GYNALNMIGKRLMTSRYGESQTGLYEAYLDVVEKDKNLKKEYKIDHNGQISWFHVTASKLDDGCVATFTDITQRKRYERDLLIKNKELEESNKSLEQFAYVASHDLQEPLRKVRTFGDRVTEKYKDKLNEKGVDYLKRMNRAAERMQMLINDLLKYSRVARQPKTFEQIELNDLIKGILSDLDMMISQRKARIKVDDLNKIYGSRMQLQQLFQNLLINAIKFTPEDRNPEIKITGKKVNGIDQKDFNININQNFLRVEIIDNGIGFEKKYADRIFQIFERLHGKNEFQGSGIGLAICHKVVQNHNGFIRAEPNKDNGARFIILLPLTNR